MSISANKNRAEDWTLSATGNWSEYKIDADGDGNYTAAADLDQDREHNLANEIADTSGDGDAIGQQADPDQTAWTDPNHDAC